MKQAFRGRTWTGLITYELAQQGREGVALRYAFHPREREIRRAFVCFRGTRRAWRW